jgi:hypothetical protein
MLASYATLVNKSLPLISDFETKYGSKLPKVENPPSSTIYAVLFRTTMGLSSF